MKKLKIRGREIKKLGYKDDKIISYAINIISKNYKKNQKVEALEKLEKIYHSPADYIEDNIFSQFAQLLLKPIEKKKEKKEIKLTKNKSRPYKIYGRQDIDEGTIEQMDTAMSLPITLNGALMADAHQGYGLPIGGVLATINAIIPYAVGMDIGCRMCMSIYSISPDFIDQNRSKLKELLIENTRFGRAEFNDIKEHRVIESNEFNEIKFLRSLKDKAFCQLGTSGGGNHFVDIGIVNITKEHENINLPLGNYFAVLSHSGSRGMGADIASHYTRIAKEKCQLPKGAINLAWLNLNEQEGEEYWKAMNLAGKYSSANHHIIHQKISKALGEKAITMIENHHNFAWKEEMAKNETVVIHRKGATPALKGMLGIIPGSMATPGFIVAGKGNSESLNSASHGAGR
ncbi:MAG: RtcB family protein, partial [Bacteroidales bacterium]|nr:RtcB family protein [Bacteroidales bacterium]